MILIRQKIQLTLDSRKDPAAHLNSDIFLFYTLSFELIFKHKSEYYLLKNILTYKRNKLSEIQFVTQAR